jgi:hypothetical protein
VALSSTSTSSIDERRGDTYRSSLLSELLLASTSDMLPGLRSLAVLALGAFALASPAAAKSALGIKNAKVSVTSPDGLNDASYTSVA